MAAALLGAGGPRSGPNPPGRPIGRPSRSPLAGLEGDSQFNDPVTLSAQFTAATADRPAVLMITADIAPGWHVYSLTQPPGGPTKTKIELTASPQYHLAGQFRSQPEPIKRVDNEAWVGLTIEEHDGQVTWYAPIELAAGVDPASLTITGKVRMLACKESCIPVNKDFTARLGRGVPIGELDSDADPCPTAERICSSHIDYLPARRLRSQNLGPLDSRRDRARRRRPARDHAHARAELAHLCVCRPRRPPRQQADADRLRATLGSQGGAAGDRPQP